MFFTEKSYNGKKLAKLSIGCMRFDSCSAANDIINRCVENGVLYLDTSPGYCMHSETENTETWVGRAIKGKRDRVILAAKCSPGNGGDGIGEFDLTHGFSAAKKDQLKLLFEQSLRRLDVDFFDIYQMWAVHSPTIYQEAKKPGGWLEGVYEMKERGLFRHLGITTHGGNDMIRQIVDDGIFELMTVPFSLMDTSRLEGIEYAVNHGMAVIAMNPLAGGMLSGKNEKLADIMAEYGMKSVEELALKFVTAFKNVSALAGMSDPSHAATNLAILESEGLRYDQALDIAVKFISAIRTEERFCTGCGYCKPCPMDIDIPGILRIRNNYKIFGLESAYHELKQNCAESSKCIECKNCEEKCPNGIKVTELLAEISKIS